MKKTHYQSYMQAKKIISLLSKNNSNIKIMIKNNKKEKWSKKLYTRKNLNDLYVVSLKIKKNKLKNVVRATLLDKYKPYINLHNYRFELKN